MESAVLIHPALEFLLIVLPFAPDCSTTDQKTAPRLPHLCPSYGADFWGKLWDRLGQDYEASWGRLQIN